MGPDSLRSNIFYIRADANLKIGTGHIMRCIALAQAWQDHGGEVTFISHCESEALRERIQSEWCRFIALDHVCPDSSDLKNTLAILKTEGADQKNWLVLDGYHFTPKYQKAIRDEGIRLLVIDDMNHLPCYHADILLNQNIHAPDLKYHCDENTTLLLGTRYVLLRREFLKYRDFNRQIPDRARNILVTLGGADPDNVTLKVIEALTLVEDKEIEVKIVIGPANPHREILTQALSSTPYLSELITNPSNMPELMAWADLAISGAGSTCWEMAFMGVPNIVMILADNQKPVAEGIAKIRMALNLGWYNVVNQRLISQSIYQIILSKNKRINMAKKGHIVIDGSGTKTLVKKLNAISISICPVMESDCELIWKWANDPEVRSSAFSSDFIPFEDHRDWFYSKIRNPQCFQFIGYNGNSQPIGQIRFDAVGDGEFEVDVSVDKDFRGREYGVQLIKKGIYELLQHSNVKIVHSYVKSSKHASKNTFIKADFFIENIQIIQGTESYHLIWKRQ